MKDARLKVWLFLGTQAGAPLSSALVTPTIAALPPSQLALLKGSSTLLANLQSEIFNLQSSISQLVLLKGFNFGIYDQRLDVVAIYFEIGCRGIFAVEI